MKKGSALLIVLGMLAFMIVSAVAFSSYMRYSRLPSSYLRRSSASRMLARAAVARAVDEIDQAICNNPHPGLGNLAASGGNRNFFKHRVFIGDDTLGSSFADTAAVLSLEALAYIPPPLVNEARYYGRLSPTAAWQSFDFDAGRYAYVALDVSDYFDVNRLSADLPRSSASNARVSLAYLFETGGTSGHAQADAGASEWDNWLLEKFRSEDSESLGFKYDTLVPLVSLADFNLALGAKGDIGKMSSPFYDYVSGETANGAGFYGGSSTDWERYRRMTFVTDSWFPEASGVGNSDKDYDLTSGEGQPFEMSDLRSGTVKLSDLVLGKKCPSDGPDWVDLLSGLGVANLWDYLDPDHLPVSLAVPTVERVPMVCALQPSFSGEFALTRKTDPEDPDAGQAEPGEGALTRTAKATLNYTVSKFANGFMTAGVESLLVFPFAHPDETDSTYNVDGRFSFFFSTTDLGLRTGSTGKNTGDALHLAVNASGTIDTRLEGGVASVQLSSKQVALPTQIKKEEDAVVACTLPLTSGQSVLGSQFAGNPFLSIVYEWEQTATVNPSTGLKTWSPTFADMLARKDPNDIKEVTGVLPPVDGTGKPMDLKKCLTDGTEIRLNAAVWLRVIDTKNNKTVDMVPACFMDDEHQNGTTDAMLQQMFGQWSPAYPLMRFDTGVQFHLTVDELDKLVAEPKPVALSPSAVAVADPRFNHAPENWFSTGFAFSKDGWVSASQSAANDRDGDIFLATSDAGYLQSKYELAHLLQLSNLKSGGDVFGRYKSPYNATYTSLARSETSNGGLAWKTYDPLGDDADAFDELPLTSEGRGFKVNPYTDSTNVMMAVFANTPLDWKRASTNAVSVNGKTADYAAMELSTFNKKYAWNEYNEKSSQQLDYRDLEALAGAFMKNVCPNRNDGESDGGDTATLSVRTCTNWEEAWEKSWDADDLFPNSAELWLADRKFLYGYWKDCFAVRQQLFLVFVRAEPLMMGGGPMSKIPPQLGARAVALVWRDPTETSGSAMASGSNGYPHRTRLLFYKTLE